jgi:hypothetical protein
VEAAGVAAGVAAVEADSAEVDFFERLFFVAAALLPAGAALAVESFAAAALLSAEADFFEELFLAADEVELSAAALLSAAADFADLLVFFGAAVPVSLDAWADDASEEAVSAFVFFLVFFLVESAWL